MHVTREDLGLEPEREDMDDAMFRETYHTADDLQTKRMQEEYERHEFEHELASEHKYESAHPRLVILFFRRKGGTQLNGLHQMPGRAS